MIAAEDCGEENVVKKFLSLLVVAAVCVVFVGECSAERVCVVPDFKDGAADLCIETAGINNGEWSCCNTDEESARMAQITIRRGTPVKNYATDERTFVEDIFDKACEYIDAGEIGNTEAKRFGERGNGVMVSFQ